MPQNKTGIWPWSLFEERGPPSQRTDEFAEMAEEAIERSDVHEVYKFAKEAMEYEYSQWTTEQLHHEWIELFEDERPNPFK